MSCVICYESLFSRISQLGLTDSNRDWESRPAVLTCGHVFHQACISAWLAHANRKTCPTCRKQHRGNPIALYFDTSGTTGDDGGGGQPEESAQISHRNKVIQTLCSNIETGKKESEQLSKELAELQAKNLESKDKLEQQIAKVKEFKTRETAYKKTVADLKTTKLKLENMVAEGARDVEELEHLNKKLVGQLDEQKRVVEAMGDVRSNNERLARSLKTERSKVETQTTLSAQLANKVANLEEKLAMFNSNQGMEAAETMPAAANNTSFNEAELEEDMAAISHSLYTAKTKPRKAKKTTTTSSFEIPVCVFDGEDKPKVQANPFATQSLKPPGSVRFTLGTKTTHISTGSKHRERALRRPPSILVSDGMGGPSSTRHRNKGAASTSSCYVQAKINWGTKPQP